MNLKRQLLLVSLLTLVLPWAGCQFIRESESALRAGQQQMLAGTARAIADSLAQYPEEFPDAANGDYSIGDQLYGHRLETRPAIDGYFNDWLLDRESLVALHGVDGPIHLAIGIADEAVYLYVRVSDRNVVYTTQGGVAVEGGPRYSDRITLTSTSPPYREEELVFAAEAPGQLPVFVRTAFGFAPEPTIRAHWQDVPGGYQVEARIPMGKLGTHLGVTVSNTSDEYEVPARSASFTSASPGAFVTASPDLGGISDNLVPAGSGMRLIVTDAAGWRIAQSGSLTTAQAQPTGPGALWLRRIYDLLVEPGEQAGLAEPDALGREQQDYIDSAREGTESVAWFRSAASGRAVVAVAEPIRSAGRVVGAIVLQQGTERILSLQNETLARLITVTLIATIVVAVTLLGYATWLSRRIRGLSVAAEAALEGDALRTTLPSAAAGDEIGDLSRSFSNVLHQLGDYNDYLRSLASKLSHELRTPLAIVTSSLENLEHEPLNDASKGYASRAKDGADRLRRILTAMSEASRVEELMRNAEPEAFDLRAALETTVEAYRDVYAERQFEFETSLDSATVHGSPELIIQMLDKLVDNAVDFSNDGDRITIRLSDADEGLSLTVHNPGPPLPDRMRHQLFDSMVSMRPKGDEKHLGLGLYVARLIAEGHAGRIDAKNVDGGVAVIVTLRQ
jgi:dedicated sortase system histidine kinase